MRSIEERGREAIANNEPLYVTAAEWRRIRVDFSDEDEVPTMMGRLGHFHGVRVIVDEVRARDLEL